MITFYVFRGLGFDMPQQPDQLIHAGHAGIQLENEPVVYGFHPSEEAIHAYEASIKRHGVPPLAKFLKQHGALRGIVYDDTVLFHLAARLAATNKVTMVWRVPMDIDALPIRQALHRIQETAPLQWYRFPEQDQSPMPIGVNNCATWPRELGVPLLEYSGQIKTLVELAAKHGTLWIP